MKTLLEVASVSYLGFSISIFTGFSFLTWQWWAIVVPSIILFVGAASMEEE